MSTETPTLVPCPSCNGEFRHVADLPDGRHAMTTCRWCDRGAMSPEQVKAWAERPKEPKP